MYASVSTRQMCSESVYITLIVVLVAMNKSLEVCSVVKF